MSALSNTPIAESWMDDAQCLDTDPDLFTNGADYRAAKKVCAGCDVIADCLAFAIRNNIGTGIFGGMTAKARRQRDEDEGIER